MGESGRGRLRNRSVYANRPPTPACCYGTIFSPFLARPPFPRAAVVPALPVRKCTDPVRADPFAPTPFADPVRGPAAEAMPRSMLDHDGKPRSYQYEISVCQRCDRFVLQTIEKTRTNQSDRRHRHRPRRRQCRPNQTFGSESRPAGSRKRSGR